MPSLAGLLFSGVYLCRNKITGKVYVGSSTKSIRGRIKSHIDGLEKNKHGNRYFQRAWNKYGRGAFAWFILRRCFPENCLKYEQLYIDKYESYKRLKGYNISPTAGNVLGVIWPESAKAEKKRRCRDPEFIERVREIFKRPKSPEHREKLRLALLGTTHPPYSAESRYKMGANRGKKLSAEKKAKMSASAKERWRKHRERKASEGN